MTKTTEKQIQQLQTSVDKQQKQLQNTLRKQEEEKNDNESLLQNKIDSIMELIEGMSQESEAHQEQMQKRFN